MKMYPSFETRNFLPDLGEHIAFYRKQKGITQQKFADLLGITRSYVYRIENASMVQSVSIGLLCNISRVLEVPVCYFMKPFPSSGTGKKSEQNF